MESLNRNPSRSVSVSASASIALPGEGSRGRPNRLAQLAKPLQLLQVHHPTASSSDAIRKEINFGAIMTQRAVDIFPAGRLESAYPDGLGWVQERAGRWPFSWGG